MQQGTQVNLDADMALAAADLEPAFQTAHGGQHSLCHRTAGQRPAVNAGRAF